MKTALLLSLLFSLNTLANTNTPADIQKVRALLPTGTDIAQVQALLMMGGTESEALKLAGENLVIKDFNSDGRKDIAVIVDENPHLENWETNEKCDKYDPAANCELSFGKRYLDVYLAQANEGYALLLSSQSIVLRADEGGIWGDPLVGLSLNRKGSLLINFYGGSAWRWSYTHTLQYRRDDFYLVGRTQDSMWVGDLRFERKDVNLITGEVSESWSKGEGHSTHRKKYRIKPKPLQKVRDIIELGEL